MPFLVLDAGFAELHALALVAIARADEQLGLEEGQRLQQRIEARSGRSVPLDDLLLSEPLEPARLRALHRGELGPFRGATVDANQFARVIVADAISVVLAKGYVAEQEARQIARFATALGCTLDEIRAMSAHLGSLST